MTEAISAPAKLAYGIEEAMHVSGLGRTFLYEHITNGQLRSVKVGGRRLILHDDLLAFLKGALAQSPDAVKKAPAKARGQSRTKSIDYLPGQLEFQWPIRN